MLSQLIRTAELTTVFAVTVPVGFLSNHGMPLPVGSRHMVLLPVLDSISSRLFLEGAFQPWAYLVPWLVDLQLCFLSARVPTVHSSPRLPGFLWCAVIPHPPFLSNCFLGSMYVLFSDLFRYSVREILYSHFPERGTDVWAGAQSPLVTCTK